MEWIGVGTGVLYVVLAAKQSIVCWPVSIMNLSVYFYIFFCNRLYADAGLQVFYFVLTLYGWFHWQGPRCLEKVPSVTPWTARIARIALGSTIGLTLVLWWVLCWATDSSTPLLDAHTTAVSLVAQGLTARKILQSWLLWIWANVFFCGLYLQKGLYPTFGLYVFFILLAVYGYREWKESVRA